MNYTDEQLKRVAEWLEVDIRIFSDSHEYAMHCDLIRFVIGGKLRTEHQFHEWLLSPEGRVAIEDKFTFSYKIYYAKGHADNTCIFQLLPNEMARVVGEGPTPAEAWLDAAVKFTEGI
jgi:hypothetical protein